MVHWRGATTRKADNKAKTVHVRTYTQLATKAGCTDLEDVETDRQGQSDGVSGND
ncbi:hypothetical protein BN190_370012 [Clostridioides difficile T14]|nr:hypothetical protein BN187_330015 [Clostridioides difficile E12]CCL92599.1 hypothetical protein BN190_370012 [Clostridioides difficile T14]